MGAEKENEPQPEVQTEDVVESEAVLKVATEAMPEVSETKKDLKVRDYEMVPDVVEAYVQEIAFLQEGRLKVELEK